MIQFATVQLHIRRHIYITLYVCLGFICSCYQLHHLVEKILHMKGNFFFFLCLQQEHYEATEVHDQVTLEPPRSFDDLQREVVSAESHHEEEFDDQRCIFCRNSPCILRSENLPDKLRASGPPRMTNHCKRKADYRALYTILKRKGLWRDPIYVQRKEALGCYIDDVREVMPVCVVEDVRKRWPNPDGVPYCGHRRT